MSLVYTYAYVVFILGDTWDNMKREEHSRQAPDPRSLLETRVSIAAMAGFGTWPWDTRASSSTSTSGEGPY